VESDVLAFLRFVASSRDQDSGFDAGAFSVAYELLAGGELTEAEQAVLREHLAWFEKHLPAPARFNRTSSKGYDRRNTKGIAWFRDTATECLKRMHALKRVLELHGHSISLVREERVGYIVHEDEFQVIAEPFSDTKTSGM
jgi:hypothetical protein